MSGQQELDIREERKVETVEGFKFDPIRGKPMLRWAGKRPFESTQYFPAQEKERYGEEVDDWMNELYWGDNLQVMAHLLKKYRGRVDLIYIDPPFDSKADYKKKIELRGHKIENDHTSFEDKQYTDIWTNDEYLQFMYERLILIHELLIDTGVLYLHCDWHKVHHMRCILDEVFGATNFRNEIIWSYSTLGRPNDRFAMKHDNLLCYGKTSNSFFNADAARVPYSKEYLDSHFRDTDDNGLRCRKRFDAGKWRIYYPDTGMIPNDVWDIAYENSMSKQRVDYPTQKPEALLERIIKASSNPGDLVFDCFMGSGTTQAVAMKLGRRFIGADINLGAVQTTTKRLLGVAAALGEQLPDADGPKYTGFTVYNVNNYDVFRNPVEAKDLLVQALELQPLGAGSLWDGELDGWFYKIMPVNRLATKADLGEIVSGFDWKGAEARAQESPGGAVLRLKLVCMGHEPDLKASLESQLQPFKVDIEVVDILRDKSQLVFKRDAEAEVVREGGKVVIEAFYPMNLLKKLSLQKTAVGDWRDLADSVMVDFNYDGVVFTPTVVDVPGDGELVKGRYAIPEGAGTIRVKITDLLSESIELEVP